MKAEETTEPMGTAIRHSLAGLGLLLALALCLLAGPISSGYAAEHTEITGEYGKTGPKSSGLGDGCRIAWDSGAEHLLVYADSKIYGLAVSPGSATALGGNFPISTEHPSYCGEPDIEVDPKNGNIYTPKTGGEGEIFGWNRAGEPLPGWPVTLPAPHESCGIDVGPNDEVFAGNYSAGGSVTKYKPDGTANGTIPTGTSFCKLAVDRSNGDIFVQSYETGRIEKLSAASGYTEKTDFPQTGTGNPGMAVNAAENRLYVTREKSISAYDTDTAALVETINLPSYSSGGLALDEATDTIFASVGYGENAYIAEYLGLPTPKATTGEPTGNEEVSGTADPNGVGPITECYFEYGTNASYELSPGVKGEQECTESTPISSVQTVHAALPSLTGEQTYHYRLVLSNGEPRVINRGGDKTIIPRNVKFLRTLPASEVTQESAVLNAEFEGTNDDTHYYFEWGQSNNYGHTTPKEDAGTTTGLTQISTAISGLEPGRTYHFRVVAENSLGVSSVLDESFTTFELPSINSATTSNVSATSADIEASINPHEFETSYYVEYGPTTTYGSVAPVSPETLAAGNSAQPVEIELTELEGVVYHFRVVATNKWGTVRSEDQSFNFFPQSCPNSTVRQQNESQYLPDCRAFELVSPEETGNILLDTAPATVAPEATDPARFAFVGIFGGTQGSEPTNAQGSDTYIATRTSAGWKTHMVGLRGFEGTLSGNLYGNQSFTKFLDFREKPEVFEGEPQPQHNLPYVWDVDGSLLERWPANYKDFGEEEVLAAPNATQSSPDLSHLAIASTSIEFAPGGLTSGPGSAYDYNAETGETSIISRLGNGNIELEPGDTETNPHFGIFFPGGTVALNEYERPVAHHPPISTDGSHILMATSSGPVATIESAPTRLYMRVNDAVTYEVSKGHDVHYVGMTPDGSAVFFTSPEELTSEDTDKSVDLYMWSETGDALTLVSKAAPGAEGSGNSDSCSAGWTVDCDASPVSGSGIGSYLDSPISDESNEIYFYSPEQLEGSKGTPNAQNLYVYREGEPQFVATLTGGPLTRINISPKGDHAAFVTTSRLTGYDNEGFAEMYSYDLSQRRVICDSCRPDGQAPEYNVEGATAGIFMADDGRTFFTTKDGLIPTDTNEGQDVYEYTEGRPQLITTGTGTSSGFHPKQGGNFGEEALAGVSADGVNVYFSTHDVLVPQNHNGPFIAFYDARVNGGFPFEPGLAPCEAADECHGTGNAAIETPVVTSEGDLGDRGEARNPSSRGSKSKKHKSKKHKHRAKGHHHRRDRGDR